MLVIGINGNVGKLISSHDDKGLFISASRSEDAIITLPDFEVDTLNRIFSTVDAESVCLLSAISSDKECNRNKELSQYVNTVIPLDVAKACKRANKRLIYISTDYVYSGEIHLAKESDSLKGLPITLYGRQKRKGEINVMDQSSSNSVLRIARVCSTKLNNNFYTNTLELIKKNKEIVAASDQYFSPLYAGDLYKVLDKLSAKAEGGIFNCGGPNHQTRVEYMHALKEIHKLNCKIKGCSRKELGIELDVPHDTSMNSAKLFQKLNIAQTQFENILYADKSEY